MQRLAVVTISFLLVLHLSACITNRLDRGPLVNKKLADKGGIAEEHCSSRLNSVLVPPNNNRRSGNAGNTSSLGGPLDLTGYALHQPLRSAPLDMYLTDMRIRAPPKWARLDMCRFDPVMGTLQARLAFNDLSVSGKVKLFTDKTFRESDVPVERCNMTLRMRQAGVGFTVRPGHPSAATDSARSFSLPGGPSIAMHTVSTFVEPQFVSVHSYGCKSDAEESQSMLRKAHKAQSKGLNDDDVPLTIDDGDISNVAAGVTFPDIPPESRAELTQEMEDVFIRGVRALLTRYLEHRMEPALRDALMMNLGYTISYGKR